VTEQILTINAGSASLKIGLFNKGDEQALAMGLADRVGDQCTITLKNRAGDMIAQSQKAMRDERIETLFEHFLTLLQHNFAALNIVAISHRVVHGGLEFVQPVIVDEAVFAQLKALEPFAPLHQPHNLAAIEAAQKALPAALSIACFDTAFHRNHPFVNDVYALPRHFYDEGVRRYGFHGLSYEYVIGRLAILHPALYAGRVIICHLGNGASACAIHNGRSIASTMGFSALDGLPMGTRCGQIDPGVLLYLMDQKGLSAQAISNLLYKQSGLLGLSGLSNDMRVLEASETPEAREAIDYFVSHIRREIGALAASLKGLDALIFCGGIGEHSAFIRAQIASGMEWLGIALDAERNAQHQTDLSARQARVRSFVIPTNEEAVMARAASALISPQG
jgi:acetate kinase